MRFADSNTLAIVDLVGGLTVAATAHKAPKNARIILYGFAVYALYGALQHATGGIKVQLK
jgi:disulfide bond formation protein DsbB